MLPLQPTQGEIELYVVHKQKRIDTHAFYQTHWGLIDEDYIQFLPILHLMLRERDW